TWASRAWIAVTRSWAAAVASWRAAAADPLASASARTWRAVGFGSGEIAVKALGLGLEATALGSDLGQCRLECLPTQLRVGTDAADLRDDDALDLGGWDGAGRA